MKTSEQKVVQQAQHVHSIKNQWKEINKELQSEVNKYPLNLQFTDDVQKIISFSKLPDQQAETHKLIEKFKTNYSSDRFCLSLFGAKPAINLEDYDEVLSLVNNIDINCCMRYNWPYRSHFIRQGIIVNLFKREEKYGIAGQVNRPLIDIMTDLRGESWVQATFQPSARQPDYASLLAAIKALGTESLQSINFNNSNLCYNQYEFKKFLRQIPANISRVNLKGTSFTEDWFNPLISESKISKRKRDTMYTVDFFASMIVCVFELSFSFPTIGRFIPVLVVMRALNLLVTDLIKAQEITNKSQHFCALTIKSVLLFWMTSYFLEMNKINLVLYFILYDHSDLGVCLWGKDDPLIKRQMLVLDCIDLVWGMLANIITNYLTRTATMDEIIQILNCLPNTVNYIQLGDTIFDNFSKDELDQVKRCLANPNVKLYTNQYNPDLVDDRGSVLTDGINRLTL